MIICPHISFCQEWFIAEFGSVYINTMKLTYYEVLPRFIAEFGSVYINTMKLTYYEVLPRIPKFLFP